MKATVHYVILLCQIPSIVSIVEKCGNSREYYIDETVGDVVTYKYICRSEQCIRFRKVDKKDEIDRESGI